MHPGGPEVRLATVLTDLDLEPFVLASAHVGQLDPIAAPRRLGVEVDRHVVGVGEPRAEEAGQLDRLVHRRIGEGHERNDVDRSDPGVFAPVLVHVDLSDRAVDESFERITDGAGRAGQGEDRAVVAGVARPVEEVNARHGHDRRGQALDDVEPATLRYIRDRFDEPVGEGRRQVGHREHRATVRPARMTANARQSSGTEDRDALAAR